MSLVALLLLALWLLAVVPAFAQQNVRVPVPMDGGRTLQLAAQLYLPARTPAPAVAIFHGCGGPGVNNARMAQLLQGWGYVALVVDSFSSRGLKDVCGRNWPTQAAAEARAIDIDAAGAWLNDQTFVTSGRLAAMGYSYGGGVGLLRAFWPRIDLAVGGWRAHVLVYPDCGLGAALGPKLRPRGAVLFAMGELDDWTPVSECQAFIERVAVDRDKVEVRIYPGAHHSFDALGLPVRYLEGVGNRSKPGGCCGAHYGAHEPAWRQFVVDVKDFLARKLPL